MLEVIADWPLDGGKDLVDQFHLPAPHPKEVADLCLVTAPRGGGKTTFARQLEARAKRKRPVKRIAITGDALALMRHVDPSPGGTEGVARYLVQLAALQALVEAGAMKGDDLQSAAPAFVPAFSPHLARLTSLLFDPDLLSALFRGSQPPQADRRTPGRQAAAIAEMLAPRLKKRPVRILFDETRSRAASAREFDALKADGVAALLAAGAPPLGASGRAAGVHVTVLCRPELVRGLPEPIMERVGAGRLDLTWNESALRTMTALRVERARRPKAKPDALGESRELRHLFAPAAERVAGDEVEYDRVGPWPYIWRRTRARPRDMVHFLRAVARATVERGLTQVDDDALQEAERVHSDYMRATVADELRPECPDIDEVISRLSELKARGGEAERLTSIVERALEQADAAADTTADSNHIIARLFEASAIGNRVSGEDGRDREVYRCLEPYAELSWANPVVVHPSLATSLALTEGESWAA